MKNLTFSCLLVVALCGCGSSDSPEASGSNSKGKMYSFDFARDVQAGEKLDMSMLRPMEIVSNTVASVDLKDVVLTSADIKEFVGKPLKKSVKKGDLLEKELFQ